MEDGSRGRENNGGEASGDRGGVSPPSPILKYFTWTHLPPHLQVTSKLLAGVAAQMDAELPDGPEKSAGLRKLLEAKDCFVRASLP